MGIHIRKKGSSFSKKLFYASSEYRLKDGPNASAV